MFGHVKWTPTSFFGIAPHDCVRSRIIHERCRQADSSLHRVSWQMSARHPKVVRVQSGEARKNGMSRPCLAQNQG